MPQPESNNKSKKWDGKTQQRAKRVEKLNSWQSGKGIKAIMKTSTRKSGPWVHEQERYIIKALI